MAEAIFGLLGVIVGGLINVGIGFVQEKRGRQQGARVSARMVLVELERNEAVLHLAEKNRTWEALENLDDSEWADHREQLARALSNKDWEAVFRAYTWIGRLIQRRTSYAGKDRLSTVGAFSMAIAMTQKAHPMMASLAGVVSKTVSRADLEPNESPQG